ncbi:MAG: type IV secretion system protein [Burkholderiales bacterium]|nr:type IV secretion system protein [Burkholderiales bacterium]
MHIRLKLTAAVLVASSTQYSHAGGIPVIDVANLVQTVQQVTNDITKISNQVRQIMQLQAQIESLNGVRNLGNVFNSTALMNYVPAKAFLQLNATLASGYAGLGAAGKALRDAGMVYNCMDLSGAARTNCQATLAQPYQHKGMLQDAMTAAAGRLGQIQALMRQINATSDQKSIQEIQARIGAENALLAHETSQIQMLQGMAESDERIARSRDRERQYEMLNRTGKVSSYLH